MMRFFLWTLGGVFLGLIIHLVVILNLPRFSSHDLWDQIAARTVPGKLLVLDPVKAGDDNPLELDPLFATAICQLDLTNGPGLISGPLPDSFWSIAVFNDAGIAFYSTTHRASSNNKLKLGIFNAAQTKLLSQQEIGADSELLVVESAGDAVFAAIRLAPPHRAGLERYREVLRGLGCANLKS